MLDTTALQMRATVLRRATLPLQTRLIPAPDSEPINEEIELSYHNTCVYLTPQNHKISTRSCPPGSFGLRVFIHKEYLSMAKPDQNAIEFFARILCIKVPDSIYDDICHSGQAQ